jgi:hypothetical protein
LTLVLVRRSSRKDTDDGVGLAIDSDLLADHVWIGREPIAPDAMRENDDVIVPGCSL